MRLAGGLLLLLAATTAGADYSADPRAAALLQKLQADYDFSDEELDEVQQALAAAERVPQLVELEQRAKEKTLSWPQYRAIHLGEANLQRGREFLESNRELLARAEADYGVPPEIIAGILGVETRFGAYATPHRVLDALATQGFEHPTRADFFFGELAEFFALCRELEFHPPAVRGSYAGAMGVAQFMPSNYRRLAVDFDGDGLTDLWALPDAIGSIANYLAHYDPQRAYQRGLPPAVRARLKSALPKGLPLNPKSATHRYAELAKLGIRTEVELPPEEPVGLIDLGAAGNGEREYWLGLGNFFAVMTYNPRVWYAMAVVQLADALRKQRTEAGAR